MNKQDILLYSTISIVSLVLALEYSLFVVPQQFEFLTQIYQSVRSYLSLLNILLLCTLPYFTLYSYTTLFVPVRYEKSLVETEEAPKNLTKRYRNSGVVPPPYPNGWFFVTQSEKLNVGDVKEISILGNEFALFRGEDGKARMVSAFCPHLGANLAIGGQVQNNCISCPFHGWKFDGDNGKVSQRHDLLKKEN